MKKKRTLPDRILLLASSFSVWGAALVFFFLFWMDGKREKECQEIVALNPAQKLQ